jgi:hypothetical protein
MDNHPPPDPIPFATTGGFLGVREGPGYRPIFLRGVNLGVGIPGTQPGELAASGDQYRRWLARMSEIGLNAVRVYTLHPPRFYEALDDHNRARPQAPLYLLHGIWLDEDNPGGDLHTLGPGFDASIEEVVDAVHGRRVIEERHGRAYGHYRVDVSRWVLGWIIGREVFPHEVETTNSIHSETSFQGFVFSLTEASPTEVWVTARLDHLVHYERITYGQERPVSFSSWPTLDPLRHPTEGSLSFEDAASIDLANLDVSRAPAGFFASFHAYPYYPDFMSEDPGYGTYRDDEGPNSYLGYLTELRRHYAPHPVVIAEFGVPSSWGSAHDSHSGMSHGGHDEHAQGRLAGRMLRNIRSAGCAGGLLFAWIDEWWKRSWVTDEIEFPHDRARLWHNVTAPEQNFGLIAFEPAQPDFTTGLIGEGRGRLREVRAATDVAYFHLSISLSSPLANGERLTVGLDTYGDAVGETILPGQIQASRRCEFALVARPPGDAQLLVTQAYDLTGIWHHESADVQLYHSIPTNGAAWVPVRWQISGPHGSDDGAYVFPATFFPIGVLRARRATQPASSLDAVVFGDGEVRIRLPWTLLQFTDPSTLSVMNDDRSTPAREVARSEGIAVVVALAGELVETRRFVWAPWETAPATTEREKPSLRLYGEAARAIPDPAGDTASP